MMINNETVSSHRDETAPSHQDIAVFVHGKGGIKEKLLPDKSALFAKLRDRDIRPLVTDGAESTFGDGTIEAGELHGESQAINIGTVALESVGVIVNRIGRSVKKDELATTTADNLPPLINENELRSLVFRKARVADEVLADLGIGMPTRLLRDEDDVAAFIADNPGENFIVKPNSGTFSKGVVRLDASEIPAYLADGDRYGKTIIQPAYDFTRPLDASIRPYDNASREDFERFAHSTGVKEFRFYGFKSPQGTEVFPAARSLEDGDHWFFVDPDSLPDSLEADTKKVFEKAAALTGSKAIYGALDIGYGAKPGEDPGYHVVEFNGRSPYMIGFNKHPQVAGKLRDMFADQIRATIDNPGNEEGDK